MAKSADPEFSFKGKSNHACKTRATPAFARQINAKMGIDRPASECVPEYLACEGAEEFLAAACQVSEDRGAAGFDAVVGLPTFVNEEITEFRMFEVTYGKKRQPKGARGRGAAIGSGAQAAGGRSMGFGGISHMTITPFHRHWHSSLIR